jgi:hypothetical protein
MRIKNLCDTCVVNFPECGAKPIFACDKTYPPNTVISGADLDNVAECSNYVEDPVLVDYYAK